MSDQGTFTMTIVQFDVTSFSCALMTSLCDVKYNDVDYAFFVLFYKMRSSPSFYCGISVKTFKVISVEKHAGMWGNMGGVFIFFSFFLWSMFIVILWWVFKNGTTSLQSEKSRPRKESKFQWLLAHSQSACSLTTVNIVLKYLFNICEKRAEKKLWIHGLAFMTVVEVRV